MPTPGQLLSQAAGPVTAASLLLDRIEHLDQLNQVLSEDFQDSWCRQMVLMEEMEANICKLRTAVGKMRTY